MKYRQPQEYKPYTLWGKLKNFTGLLSGESITERLAGERVKTDVYYPSGNWGGIKNVYRTNLGNHYIGTERQFKPVVHTPNDSPRGCWVLKSLRGSEDV